MSSLFCQHERHLKVFFERSKFLHDNSEWKKFKPKMSKSAYTLLLHRFTQKQIELAKPYKAEIDTSEIHFVKLDEDEFIDVIYTPCFGTCIVEIYRGTKDSFRVVFKEPSIPVFLKELKFSNQRDRKSVV